MNHRDETTNLLKITVIGIGGAGGNAVNNMIRSKLRGVEFLVCNTDAQALQKSLCDRRVQLGLMVTRGLGAGSKPDIGRAAAEESLEEVMSLIKETDMLFITAGAGGGTGTGAVPIIGAAARKAGILTIGIVTKPFEFEGQRRMAVAEKGIEEMHQAVDTLLVIPNQNLICLANEQTTFEQSFAMADDVLFSGVRTFTDLAVNHGLINLDFADVCTVMRDGGPAMMGCGEAFGPERALEAASKAIACPLLNDLTIKGARSVLINISGPRDMKLDEVRRAGELIQQEVSLDANIIFGATIDNELDATDEQPESRIRVSVIATGISVDQQKAQTTPAARAKRPEPVKTRESVSGNYVGGNGAEEALFSDHARGAWPASDQRVEKAALSAFANEPSNARMYADPKFAEDFQRVGSRHGFDNAFPETQPQPNDWLKETEPAFGNEGPPARLRNRASAFTREEPKPTVGFFGRLAQKLNFGRGEADSEAEAPEEKAPARRSAPQPQQREPETFRAFEKGAAAAEATIVSTKEPEKFLWPNRAPRPVADLPPFLKKKK